MSNSDHLSPNESQAYRASDVPTISSYYSQASPDQSNFESAAPTHSGFVDVSPPSSPEPERQQQRGPDQPRRFRSMRDVSPVDENRGQAGARSNIPVLRKAPSTIRDGVPVSTQKFWGGKVAPDSNVRWDPHSGEPTASTVGKPGQVNPLTFAKEALSPPSDQKPMGYHVSVKGGPQDVPKKNIVNPPQRTGHSPTTDTTTMASEPWSRASGRVEIVKPFKDIKRTREPLHFQRQTQIQPRTIPGSAQNPSTPLGASVKRGPGLADTEPVAEDRDDLGQFDTPQNPIKPIVPLKFGKSSPPSTVASLTGLHNPYSYPSPITPTNKQPLQISALDEQGELITAAPRRSFSPPPSDNVVRKSIEGTPGSTVSLDHGPSDSRFSWTTYNTGTTFQRSPPPSPPPPLPVSRVPTEPISAASSILNRRRPLAPSDKVPLRKPVSTATMSTQWSPPSPRPDSTFSTMTSNTQKALPRPPTEISAADHVDTLEAQMEDLRIRRSNVFRLLNDLNNMAPPNPLITDFKRMRLVDRRKKEFEEALAEIRREEHDVGLKLHRAYRKRENADPGSESAIWIRRVTR